MFVFAVQVIQGKHVHMLQSDSFLLQTFTLSPSPHTVALLYICKYTVGYKIGANLFFSVTLSKVNRF